MKPYDLTTEAIENRIKELAKYYTPEWQFDGDKPDIGTTIARLFAAQMKENADMANRMMDRYHTEFVNMLDISQKAAKAAGSLVCFTLIEDTVPGIFIRKGTRLLSDMVGADGDSVYFETDREIYVTAAKISEAFMTDREDGTFVPLLGDFTTDSLIEGTEVIPVEENEASENDEAGEGLLSENEETSVIEAPGANKFIRPFVLFSEMGSISKSILVIYHDYLFDLEDEPIYIRISGNSEFTERILNGDYRFCYYAKNGPMEFNHLELLDDQETFLVRKSEKCKKFRTGNKEYGVVTLEDVSGIRKEVDIGGISLSSSGAQRPLDYVDDGTTEMDIEHFAPFSDTLSVYNECYLGQDLYFSKAGAKITVRFRVSYPEHFLYLTRQQEEEALKIIKKKPKVLPADIPAEAYADEICLEYYNGTGFKRLKCFEDTAFFFSQAVAKELSFSFICPPDWAEIQTGAFSGRAIRMRLVRSDNCFLRPSVHHYPVIAGIRVAFSYEGKFVPPKKLQLFAGTRRKDITAVMRQGGPNRRFVVMSSGEYGDDALYIGFDRKLENGPVSLYFELEEILHQKGLLCNWEYSTDSGFKQMKVLDQTASFTKSGSVFFIPPPDMVQTELENRRRYWIKIRRAFVQNSGESALFLPRIRRILLNVVGVTNVVTSPEENYYLSEVRPSQRVTLSTGNILSADVWVNETGNLSREEIERLKYERPDDVRSETDVLGNVSEVYVKWHETESFLSPEDRRSYMLDRVTGEIVFADGIHADIPKVTDDVSFKVRLRTTDGKLGNVEMNQISETADTVLYIDSVTNPVRAYGGRDMETVEEALTRGANIICGRGRLVSARDYIWDILNFSDSIAKAACMPGVTIDGICSEADLSIVLLMRDHEEGSFSFQRIAPSLKEYLLRKTSITVSHENLHIVEPIFVTVSVNVWAEIMNVEENFEIQSMITATLSSYLDPVNGNGGDGWEIGSIPRNTQIVMKLAGLKNHALVRKTAMTARYVDRDGEHETDLDKLVISPFMIVRSGKHQVHIGVKE
ncbi:MAG: hypothetical protein K6G83_11465 [Lachnospiraceae bacterium]|nr:hypothetical protein [Lachnospiraceae bacterium]